MHQITMTVKLHERAAYRVGHRDCIVHTVFRLRSCALQAPVMFAKANWRTTTTKNHPYSFGHSESAGMQKYIRRRSAVEQQRIRVFILQNAIAATLSF